MFTRRLYNADSSKAAAISDPAAPDLRMADYSYGKQAVRVFQLKKDGPVHYVTEFKVTSHMRLRTHKEYYNADNSDIIGSDVQETNIYVHAQKHGLSTPEEFALSLSEHFLNTYDLVMESNVIVEELGWLRLGEAETQGVYKNQKHNHAFVRDNNGRRYCEVVRKRDDPLPLLIGGITNLRLMKTAQAPFVGYVKGALFTEGDNPDRILCTEVNAKWQYSRVDKIDFSTHWYRVREQLLQSFAGEPDKGVTTTSVQFVAYTAACAILKAMEELSSVNVSLDNLKYFGFDFSKFPPIENKANVIICNPSDVPLGIGYAQVDRKNMNENANLYGNVGLNGKL